MKLLTSVYFRFQLDFVFLFVVVALDNIGGLQIAIVVANTEVSLR